MEIQEKQIRVKVAARVRPLNSKECLQGASLCLDVYGNTLAFNGDKQFTFDHVFDSNVTQPFIFNNCIRPLIDQCFDGYNSTILAYGQTGSGKTFTMGTSSQSRFCQEQKGIIPRVIEQLFNRKSVLSKNRQCLFKASFIEIYNDQIIDLLTTASQIQKIKSKILQSSISIKEEQSGSISLLGVTQQIVDSPQQLARVLDKGALNRSTSSTNMNQTSSRSHGIFTVFIQQHIIQDLYKSQKVQLSNSKEGYLCAKFRFVDLAGSQRPKKTGAVGNTMKQGIKINMGLLALGNVISALTDSTSSKRYIPYRDSKLTRLLQDSLGGNANTLMIACLSPADSNFDQSLNTLKYASRAMHIKNKPIKNLDPQQAKISQLKQKIFALQAQLKKRGRKSDDLQEESLQNLVSTLNGKVTQLTKSNLNLQVQLYNIKQQLLKSSSRVSLLEKITVDNNLIIPESQQGLNIQQICKAKELQIERLNSQLLKACRRQQLMKTELQGQIREKELGEQALVNFIKNVRKEDTLKFKQAVVKSLQQKAPQQVDLVLSKIAQCQGILLHDSELNAAGQKLQQQNNNNKIEVQSLTQQIKQKQQTMNLEKKHQIVLQSALICQLNDFIQKKNRIKGLEQSLFDKQRQRQDALAQGDKVKALTIKNQIGEIQSNMRQLRKKQKEIKDLQKTVLSQRGKLSDLDIQIKQFRQQRLIILKRSKQQQQRFQKMRMQKFKQILQAKKQTRQKETENKKLKFQNCRVAQLLRKKSVELSRLKNSNQFLKAFFSRGKIRPFSQQGCQQTLQAMLDQILTKALLDIERSHSIQKEQQNLMALQRSFQDQLDKQTIIKLKVEQLKLGIKSGFQIDNDQLHLQVNKLNQIHSLMETLQHSIIFSRNKITQLSAQGLFFDSQTELLKKIQFMSEESLRNVAVLIMARLNSVAQQFFGIKRKLDQFQQKSIQNEQIITNLKSQIVLQQHTFQNQLDKLRQQIVLRVGMQPQQEQQLAKIRMVSSTQLGHADQIKKAYQKKIHQLNRKLKHSQLDLQQIKRKCNVVQEKYDSIKRANLKDKFIGRVKEDSNCKFVTLKEKRQNLLLSKRNFSQVNLLSHATPVIKKNSQDFIEINDSDIEDQDEQLTKRWQLSVRIQAHPTPILSIANYQHFIYSSASKSIRLWDVQKSSLIQDLTNHPHLHGFIKSVNVIPERSLLVATCQKNLTLWDRRSMDSVAILKNHKQQVRVIQNLDENRMVSGGKGTLNGGAVLFWDLRTLSCIEQKQKNQDIFSMALFQQILHYGNRSHQVRRMNFNSYDILPAYEPPHFDTVSALANLQNLIVSGSRDKTVKIWQNQIMISSVSIANDWINLIRPSKSAKKQFFVGCRDGLAKLCKIVKDKVKVVGRIQTGPQSLNGLLQLNEGRICSGSADKLIRFWRPTGVHHEI